MKRIFTIILSAILISASAYAQHAKSVQKVVRPAKGGFTELINRYEFSSAMKELQTQIGLKGRKRQPVAEETRMLDEARKGASMLSATQKIRFIDSIIVAKTDFLKAIKLNKESGRITPFHEFFNTSESNDSYVFTNELDNKSYYAQKDSTGLLSLYTSDKLGGKWSHGEKVKGLEGINSDINYPFMMSDGTTLYFAAKGKESLGGYDIFVTRYDAEKGQFLKPDNIGMPFNSPSNDYMYAENDIDSIGWFVTDRNQTPENVCVYIFVPSETRKIYDAKLYNESQIRKFARIASIKDTWNNIAEHNNDMERYQAMITRENKTDTKRDFEFVINDATTYVSLNDFKSPTNKEQFGILTNMKSRYKESLDQLEMQREQYHAADENTRNGMKEDILNKERQLEKQYQEILKLEKSIRNTENILINNK